MRSSPALDFAPAVEARLRRLAHADVEGVADPRDLSLWPARQRQWTDIKASIDGVPPVAPVDADGDAAAPGDMPRIAAAAV